MYSSVVLSDEDYYLISRHKHMTYGHQVFTSRLCHNRNVTICKIFFFFSGLSVSGGFVSRGRNKTPVGNDKKGKARFEDRPSAGEVLIDASLRALSRHWLECYFNKTAKYDSVHIQARRLFSFETYDISENDKMFLDKNNRENMKIEGAQRLPIEQYGYKNRKNEEPFFGPDITSTKEHQIKDKETSHFENIPNESHYKTTRNTKTVGPIRERKRMRRDVSDSTLVTEGVMKITDGVEWTDDFLNNTSQAYQQLEEMVLSVVSQLF